MTFANDFLISSLFFSASSAFFPLCSLTGCLVYPRLAFGEFLKLLAEGLKNCLEDCVPVVIPVVFFVWPFRARPK